MVAGFEDPGFLQASLTASKARGERVGAQIKENLLELTITDLNDAIDTYKSLLNKEREAAASWIEASGQWKRAAIDQCSRAEVYLDFITSLHTRLRGEIEAMYGVEGARMIDQWMTDWNAVKIDQYEKKREAITQKHAQSSSQRFIMDPETQRKAQG